MDNYLSSTDCFYSVTFVKNSILYIIHIVYVTCVCKYIHVYEDIIKEKRKGYNTVAGAG